MANKVYDYVTERIIEQLETGTIPWSKPWQGGDPINYVSRKPYRGVNRFLLPKGGEYMTFNQAKKLGGKVKKGSKSNMIVFWKLVPYKKSKKATEVKGEDKKEDKKDKKEKSVMTYPILRYYNVFHIDDIEGIETKLEKIENDPIESAEEIVKSYDEVKIVNERGNAFYSPNKDFINVPDINKFPQVEEYYSTLFHEMIHSTGHKTRLNRFKPNESTIFGSKTYSKEELVAELGASMLCGVAGIEDEIIDNSASYIDGWLKKLKNDNTLIISASSKAQKACDYVTKNIKVEESDTEEEEVA